ncbi:14422_t:CDS:2 [Rhizophagus irregularis]|nr:14422_t:CDS:2 [Rhizophagus irregularis]
MMFTSIQGGTMGSSGSGETKLKMGNSETVEYWYTKEHDRLVKDPKIE